jgi:hypothetical protein
MRGVCMMSTCGGCFIKASSSPTGRRCGLLEMGSRFPRRRFAMCTVSCFRSLLLPIVFVTISWVSLPESSVAFDSATICAWKRTWHAQYAPATPLRPYFVPRRPGRCDREVHAAGFDCAGGSLYGGSAVPYNYPAPGPGWMYRPEAGIGFEPVQFQRLGPIPNDLGVGSETPAASAPPR